MIGSAYSHVRRPVVLAAVIATSIVITAVSGRGRAGPHQTSPRTLGVDSTNGVGASVEIESVDWAVQAGGRWYVVDHRAHTIHVLDSTARLVRSIGRRGQGPGELARRPSLVAVAGERVYVTMTGAATISVFDTTGRFIGILPVSPTCHPGMIRGMAAREQILVVIRSCAGTDGGMHYRAQQLSSDGTARWLSEPFASDRTADGRLQPRFPIVAIDGKSIVVGDGVDACLAVLRAPPEGSTTRCFADLPRHQVPVEYREELERKGRGRIVIDERFPRAARLAITDGRWAVLNVDGPATARWWWVSANGPPTMTPWLRTASSDAFLGDTHVLAVTEAADGLRLRSERVDSGGTPPASTRAQR